MTENEKKILLALARRTIELQNELIALKMLYQHRSGFSEEEYQDFLRDARKLRADILSGAAKADAQTLDDLLRDFEGPVQ
jgi:hypothetical protein